jgi:hypothetical protein
MGNTIFGNVTWVTRRSSERGNIRPLGGVETVMDAPSCPICSRALKISTIEPHPTRDREDVVTYRCLVHGDISVVNRVEAAGMDLAKMLLPP